MEKGRSGRSQSRLLSGVPAANGQFCILSKSGDALQGGKIASHFIGRSSQLPAVLISPRFAFVSGAAETVKKDWTGLWTLVTLYREPAESPLDLYTQRSVIAHMEAMLQLRQYKPHVPNSSTSTSFLCVHSFFLPSSAI